MLISLAAVKMVTAGAALSFQHIHASSLAMEIPGPSWILTPCLPYRQFGIRYTIIPGSSTILRPNRLYIVWYIHLCPRCSLYLLFTGRATHLRVASWFWLHCPRSSQWLLPGAWWVWIQWEALWFLQAHAGESPVFILQHWDRKPGGMFNLFFFFHYSMLLTWYQDYCGPFCSPFVLQTLTAHFTAICSSIEVSKITGTKTLRHRAVIALSATVVYSFFMWTIHAKVFYRLNKHSDWSPMVILQLKVLMQLQGMLQKWSWRLSTQQQVRSWVGKWP